MSEVNATTKVSMVSAVTAETFKNAVFNAGILLYDVDIAAASSAEDLMTLITNEENRKKWIGATQGNININENKSYWTPDINGLRNPFVGQSQVDKAEPKISGTIVEITPENIKLVSGAADKSGTGNKIIVQPRASIKKGDYLGSVIYIGNKGDNNLWACVLKNALCKSGMNAQTVDKGIMTVPFEFEGHSDSAVYTDELPITYYFFGSAAES